MGGDREESGIKIPGPVTSAHSVRHSLSQQGTQSPLCGVSAGKGECPRQDQSLEISDPCGSEGTETLRD